jgi:hypothetical protein
MSNNYNTRYIISKNIQFLRRCFLLLTEAIADVIKRNRFCIPPIDWRIHGGARKHNPLVSLCHTSHKQISHETWYVSTPLPLWNFQSTCKSSVTGHKTICIHIPIKKIHILQPLHSEQVLYIRQLDTNTHYFGVVPSHSLSLPQSIADIAT